MSCPGWLTEKPIAHRGVHGVFEEVVPENSFASIKRAIEHNLPFETDVQMTLDKKIIVFHDRDLKRMTNQRGSTTRQSYAKLKDVRLASNGEPIPTLEEILSLVSGKVPIVLEVKPALLRHVERAQAVYDLVKDYSGPIALQSFDPRIVEWLKKKEIAPVGLILGRYRDSTMTPAKHLIFDLSWKEYRNSFRRVQPDFVAHDILRLSPEISNAIRQKMPLLTWTVKTPELKVLADVLADNIIFENLGQEFLDQQGEKQ